MKTLKELKEEISQKLKEARALAERSKKGELNEQEQTGFETLMGEIRTLKGEIEQREQRDKDANDVLELDQHYNQPAGRRASGRVPTRQTQHERERADEDEAVRSLGQRYVHSEEFQAHIRANAQGPGGRMDAGSLQEVRTLVETGTFPTGLVAPQRIPGIFLPERPIQTVRSAFLSGSTESDTIEFFRELINTNNAAYVAQATATGGSSGTKPESAFTFEGASTSVKTLAHWIPVTRQALWDFPQIQSIIDTRLIQGLDDVVDSSLLNGDGVGANLKGLLAYSGLQVHDNTYFAGDPVKDAGTDNENFNRVLRSKRLIFEVGRARASFIFLNPADSEKFATTTDANRQYLGGGPYTSGSGSPRLWGLPAIETEEIAEGTYVIGDGRMAQVWDRMAASIMIGTINDQLIRNMVTVLAEERLALAVYREAAFAEGQFAA